MKDVVRFGVLTPKPSNKHKVIISLKKFFSENITTIAVYFKIYY